MTDNHGLPRLRVAILGSTGSIGVSTLEVIARHPDRFEVFALSASTQVDKMLAQCVQFKPAFAVMASPDQARLLAEKCKQNGLLTHVLPALTAIDFIASHEQVDIVMAAIVGAAGLSSCLAAARAGKRLLLANKEALVVGGDFFLQAVATGGAKLLPIDSEHSAVFQSLPDHPDQWPTQIDKIILTASGGPFRQRDPATFAAITPEQACAHPNWVMGRKISVDSATMMNKALEVIEARLVQYRDHSVVAQLGTPDMKVPIAYGLSWPDRIASGARALDFSAMTDLTFEAVHAHGHAERFPGLKLAWSVLAAAPGSTAVLNAANEVAVASFLSGQIRFDQIHAVNTETLSGVTVAPPGSLQDLLALDELARQAARQVVARIGR